MLEGRLYRAGLVPVMFAVVLVAFSLGEAPQGLATRLAAQAFDGGAAARTAERLRTAGGAARGSGQAGDERMAALARRELARRGFAATSRPVSVRTDAGRRTVPLVLGQRTGLGTGTVTVVADRASVAATGALLELARVASGRGLTKTLLLVSTAGGAGGGGTEPLGAILPRPAGAVIVLGPLGEPDPRTPWVVPWSTRGTAASIGLRRTVERALAAETDGRPAPEGGLRQFVRLAFPLTLGAQGPLVERGIPAVLVAPHGERPAGPVETVDPGILGAFGRGVLRALTALDAGPPPDGDTADLLVVRHVLPAWAVRLLVAAGILPVLLVLVDGLARLARRRDRPLAGLRWALVAAAPLVAAALLLRLLGVAGIVDAGPVIPGDAGSFGGTEIAALVLALVVVLGGWIGLRPVLARALGADAAGASARAGGVLLVAVGVAVALWLGNPYAAALVVPALHLWVPAAVPDLRPSRRVALGFALAGLVPPAVVALVYAFAFDLGPIGLVRNAVLALAGGAVGVGDAVLWALAAGALAGTVVLAGEGPRPGHPPGGPAIRGPLGHAGPGSLGGVASALRR